MADSTELKHGIYPTSTEGIQYHALCFSLRVKQLEREAAYLCLVTRMCHCTAILPYPFTVRAAGTERFHFQQHETQIFSVWGSLGVLDRVGYASFERIRDVIPNMWK